MRKWSDNIKLFLDRHPQLTALYKNAGILFGGNASSAAISLVAMTILTRALGLEAFGTYALITAYIALIDRLVSFQTWQALIHFGMKALQEKAHGRLSSLLIFGYILDLFSGALGAVLAMLGAIFVPSLFGLGQVDISVLSLAVLVLLFNWGATPTAILRIFDKFYLQALYLNVIAFLKLSGYLILWLTGSKSIVLYVAVWALSTVTGRLFLSFMSWREARRNGLLSRHHIDLSKMFQETQGIWRFVLTTNLDGIVRIVRDADIFIVNAILGTSATALYKIARELARIPAQLTGPFYQAIYPELSKLASAKNWRGFKKLMTQSSVSLGAVVVSGWIVFGLLGQWVISIAFGDAYIAAYSTAFWCIGAVVVWAFAQPLSPAMMSLGKVQTNLVIHLITNVSYIVMLWIFTHIYGLVGAGISLFTFYTLWSTSMLFFFGKTIKEIARNET